MDIFAIKYIFPVNLVNRFFSFLCDSFIPVQTKRSYGEGNLMLRCNLQYNIS